MTSWGHAARRDRMPGFGGRHLAFRQVPARIDRLQLREVLGAGPTASPAPPAGRPLAPARCCVAFCDSWPIAAAFARMALSGDDLPRQVPPRGLGFLPGVNFPRMIAAL